MQLLPRLLSNQDRCLPTAEGFKAKKALAGLKESKNESKAEGFQKKKAMAALKGSPTKPAGGGKDAAFAAAEKMLAPSPLRDGPATFDAPAPVPNDYAAAPAGELQQPSLFADGLEDKTPRARTLAEEADSLLEEDSSGEEETAAGEANGYGTVAVDLAAEARKLKEAQANAKPGDPLYVHEVSLRLLRELLRSFWATS